MKDLEKRAQNKIDELKAKNLLRTLGNEKRELVDLTSNDYLGLARSDELHRLISEKASVITPPLNGATGSRLLSGNSLYVEGVEKKLASIFKSESALIFNSGYVANLGVLSSLPQKGDTIFYDELSHACIKDGARLSLAKRFSFRHNDTDDLRIKLKRNAEGLPFIAVESIYSMDGDQCPLNDLIDVAEEFNAIIILDEAHSTGILGARGGGLAVSMGLETKIPVRIHTFGKAMGIHGACVACSDLLTSYLINFSRPFIYTTALPQHSIVSIDCAFDFLEKNIHLQRLLKHKVELFKKHCNIETSSSSPIQPVLISGNQRVKKISRILLAHGLDVRPILSPTVKAGTERLRICLHTFDEDKDILALAATLNEELLNES